MQRKCNDLIEDYLRYTRNTESPTSYHLWACLGVISSILERRVLMKWGHTKIYPNQYIALIGPSGVRKAEPLIVARSFLEDVQVPLVAESITREALIRRMKNASSSFTFPYGDVEELQWQCAVSCIIEELATFLSGDPRFLVDLTSWYDSRDQWVYETKNQGIDDIRGVCLNILGSMAPDWIPLVIPSTAIGGGFTSRIMFVVEHHKARTITNPNKIGVDAELRLRLQSDFEAIRSLSGEMIFHPRALPIYEEWYEAEEKKSAAGNPAIRDPRFSGYVSRRQTNVKKIAMAISAARSDSLVITEFDLTRAIRLMEQAEVNMHETFERVGRSAYAEQTQMVLNYVRDRGRTTRRDVMRQFYRDIDAKAIEIIEGTLRSTGFVKVEADAKELSYKYTWLGGSGGGE